MNPNTGFNRDLDRIDGPTLRRVLALRFQLRI